MDNESIYAVLDIGETNTKLILGTIYSEKLNICGVFCEPTKGIEGGDITSKSDIQATISSLLSSLMMLLTCLPSSFQDAVGIV